ncbi:MAG: hypothetical protein LBG63_00655, partial [Candidatus Methanoplasma sp.]|nr:hypothetical protein [Candidatus Methanoplasma sp.]
MEVIINTSTNLYSWIIHPTGAIMEQNNKKKIAVVSVAVIVIAIAAVTIAVLSEDDDETNGPFNVV